MKKNEKLLIGILVAIAAIMLIAIAFGKNKEPNEPAKPNTNTSGGQTSTTDMKIGSIVTAEEMKGAVDIIYKDLNMPYSDLKTTEIDVEDEIMLGTYTGLASTKDIEAAVVSQAEEPTEAYAMVMIKVADVGDVENLKQWVLDHINAKRWVWFAAEKVYATNYGNTIFAVMGKEDLAKKVYNEFKEKVDGNIGTELERTVADDVEDEPSSEE